MIYFYDTFTDTPDTELQDHIPEIGTGWTGQNYTSPPSPLFRVKLNRTVKAEGVASFAHYAGIANGPLPADYMVGGELRIQPTASRLT